MTSDFDIIVVGAGHAGVEAAHAAAILGARTGLVTLSRQKIAAMPCNPAIGGVGKGQMVREIDALGGLMGRAADATGMQFRMLNRSKGPAVWGPRCQSDRHAYGQWICQVLEDLPGLTIIEAEATGIITEASQAIGVTIQQASGKSELRCRFVIVAAGTFLNGLLHTGKEMRQGGQYGEPAAVALSNSLRDCGLVLDRLKTGTCPRLAQESIDYQMCTRQDGDDPPTPFSFTNDVLHVEQVPCWITATNAEVHDVVRANLHRAPLYTGQINSTGPRYCPSFETKVVRFADKQSHLIFLEPESRQSNWVYLNGMATSLPKDVQAKMLWQIPALAQAEVLRWGYAVEYDYIPPTQVDATLQSKRLAGLFVAGQLLGTTGYEEAASAGLLAGINAALRLAGKGEHLVLKRDQAYIGVMIDDLVTKGVTEPYRMFTSRAEYRLSLRADNADRRLSAIGKDIGLLQEDQWNKYSNCQSARLAASSLLHKITLRGKTLWQLLGNCANNLDSLTASLTAEPAAELRQLVNSQRIALESLAIDARYEGYMDRQAAQLRQMQQLDNKAIPQTFDYSSISQLRHEARQRLGQVRPSSLGQALRVPGITPADVTVLAIYLSAGKHKNPRTRC